MNKIILKKGSGRRIESGHLWVFSNELESLPELTAGDIVDVISSRGYNYGKAFYHPNSLISARLLLTDSVPGIDFFISRIRNASSLRAGLLKNESMFRLVFGESDLLPGLIIDKYQDYFVLQLLSSGMEQRKNLIIDAIKNIYPEVKGIIQKDNSPHRLNEGLDNIEEVLYGEIPERIICRENDLELSINLLQGQKTGWFLDQKFNRMKVSEFSSGLNVLDCFANQGGFALNAAKGEANNIDAVDISEPAIESARLNAELNNISNINFVKADVFDFLKESFKLSKKWDMIILDPPAFAKNRKSVKNALIAYRRLNKFAIRCLNPGGFLVSSSCSQLVDENSLLKVISMEAGAYGKKLQLIYKSGQSPDHPILTSMPETNYLKFFIFRII